jgi:hypothetical protein
LTGKDFGRQNSAFGILGLLVIVRKHGMINLLWRGISSTVFINLRVKNVKMFIIPFSNNGAAVCGFFFSICKASSESIRMKSDILSYMW